MTQFKKKVSFHSNSSTIYSHNEFFNAIQFPPKCHHWDDFFDFSRMSIPSDGHVFCRRLSRGSSRFFGNYIWIWNFLMIVCAITFNRRFLLPPVILSSVWIVICISTVIDGGFREKSSSTKQQYIIPLNERVSTSSSKRSFIPSYNMYNLSVESHIVSCLHHRYCCFSQ